MRVGPLAAAALTLSGCYLAHGLDDPPPPTRRDAGASMDASAPTLDAGAPRRDAGVRPRDAGFDAIVPGLDAGPDAGCVLPVEPFPEPDVCRPETGACIEGCGASQVCIVGCLQRDETCRVCAVRNALSCFNEETRCRMFYPDVSCCIVENCGASSVDDVLNVCTAIACQDPFQRYTDCAVARTATRCREAIARCGLPPTLLGLD
ncbi:MAG: hypothetical protein H6719_26750 [Sandaracinaceae bacterium]|nr:hypothetical protein [Sandaracinaceae bacterium]